MIGEVTVSSLSASPMGRWIRSEAEETEGLLASSEPLRQLAKSALPPPHAFGAGRRPL